MRHFVLPHRVFTCPSDTRLPIRNLLVFFNRGAQMFFFFYFFFSFFFSGGLVTQNQTASSVCCTWFCVLVWVDPTEQFLGLAFQSLHFKYIVDNNKKKILAVKPQQATYPVLPPNGCFRFQASVIFMSPDDEMPCFSFCLDSLQSAIFF